MWWDFLRLRKLGGRLVGVRGCWCWWARRSTSPKGGNGEGLGASNNRLGFCWVNAGLTLNQRLAGAAFTTSEQGGVYRSGAGTGQAGAGHSLNLYNFVPYHGCCRTPQPPLLLLYRGFAMVGKLGRVNV